MAVVPTKRRLRSGCDRPSLVTGSQLSAEGGGGGSWPLIPDQLRHTFEAALSRNMTGLLGKNCLWISYQSMTCIGSHFFWPYDMSTMSFACEPALYGTYYCRAMTEYWLISAPGEKTCQQTFDRLNQVVFKQKHAFSRTFETQDNLTQATSKNQLSTNWKFHIPDLKVSLWILARSIRQNFEMKWNLGQVGTLDQLVGLSDDLGKLDVFVEQVTRFTKLVTATFKLEVCRKVSNYLGDVLEEQRDKVW